jgi:signal transduction histidine kinase
LPDSGIAITGEDNDRDKIIIYGNQIKQGIGWMLCAFVAVSSVLIYWAGKHYSARMIERINTSYQSEKAFVRSASHELNNPLTAIRGECEITLLKERNPVEYQIALSRILDETRRIIQLMKHLLFLSRGDEDILQNATESVFIAEFLRQFEQRRVGFSPDSFSFVVNANLQLLKIAIENILGNALKYSDDKRVYIRLRTNVLEIEDQGIGIPADELEYIFQPFYRGSNTHGYAGHGIGLSLSLRILSTYGAEITVCSELNKGTKVTVTFP